uniref:Transposase (Putative), gypsy type n=1 Tax=Tanacetum cinerariifolium TaxID=118510 RepID=A0A6L2LRT6_TANCI|nr:hypothetical protein [Tanacetum cinerariifolium]
MVLFVNNTQETLFDVIVPPFVNPHQNPSSFLILYQEFLWIVLFESSNSFEPEANLDKEMVLHHGHLLGGSYHGHDSIFLLNYYGVRWQVEMKQTYANAISVVGPVWSDFVNNNFTQDVKCLHFIEEGDDMFYVATYNKYRLEMHGYRPKSLMFWRCLLNVTDRSHKAYTLPLVFVPKVYSTSQSDTMDLFIKDRECEVFIGKIPSANHLKTFKLAFYGPDWWSMMDELAILPGQYFALALVCRGKFSLMVFNNEREAFTACENYASYVLQNSVSHIRQEPGRMFGSEFITIVEPGAKLINGMLGRVGPDRVAVIRPAWSDFMRRNVDHDIRLLHFVKEGHDTLYVATYNKYSLENHAYKETSLMFWHCLLRVTKRSPRFQNVPLQLEKRVYPPSGSETVDLVHNHMKYKKMMKELDFQPGHLFVFTLLCRGLFHLTSFNESGEAVTESKTYSSYVLRNAFFYLGRKPAEYNVQRMGWFYNGRGLRKKVAGRTKQEKDKVGPAGTIHAYTVSKPNFHLHTYSLLRYLPLQNFTTPASYATYLYRTSPHQEYMLEFTSEYGISEALHLELPRPEDRIVDFPKGKQEVGEKYPSMLYRAIRFPKKLEQPLILGPAETIHTYTVSKPNLHSHTYSRLHYSPLQNFATPGVSTRVYVRVRYIRGSPSETARSKGKDRGFPRGQGWMDVFQQETGEKYPSMLYQAVGSPKKLEQPILLGGREDMDMFNLIRAPNPTKVKTGTRPRAAHGVPLLTTVTASRVIEMENLAAATYSSGVPSTIERSPLDFANENPSQQSTGAEEQGQEAVAPEVPPPKNVTTTGVAPEAGQAKGIADTGPHVIKERRKRGNDGVDTNAPPKVLRRCHVDSRPTQSTHGGESLAAMRLRMGSTRPVPASRGAPLDVSDPDPLSFADSQSRPTADVAQSSKGAAAAGDPKSENTSFTSMVGSPESIYRPEWGVTNGCLLDAPEACQDLVDHIAPPGFEQKAKLLKKSVAQVARRDKRIQARENETKNLETLLETETDMKKAAEGKSAELSKELENLRALFFDLQVSNNCLSQQVSALQAQIGEEKLKAAFEEFKQYEENRVEQRCAEIDARLDALSIDFDEELYPHMLTMIAGRRWVIGYGLRLAVMKYGESTKLRQAFADVVSAGIAKGMSEGLKHGVKHRKANLSFEAIEAYDPEAEAKYIAALYALKDLKYPIVDQLESLKDAPMDVIMASLHLESDTGDDASQWIRELCPSSSQLTIPVYPEARDPTDPLQGRDIVDGCHCGQRLAILLADAATQTEISEDGASPKLLRVCTSSVLCAP